MNNKVKIITLFTAAILCFASMVAQSPDQNWLKAMAMHAQGHYQEAAELFSTAIDQNNADEKYYLFRAESYYMLGNYEKAMVDFEEAGSIRPGSGDLGMARMNAITGNFSQALLYLAQHLQSEFRQPETQLKKNPDFDELQQQDGWYDLWQKDWYTPAENLTREADILIRKNKLDVALALLDENALSFRQSADFYAARAGIFYLQENFAASLADYTMALSLNKNNAGYFFSRGLAYARSGRHRNAADDFTRGLKMKPERFDIYLERAAAFASLSDFSAAIKDAEFYLNLFHDDQKAVALCGEYYFLNEDYINALKYFNRNLKSDPNNPEYYKNRGKAYYRTRTYTYAINDLSMSLDLSPDDGETYLYLGLAMVETGDKESGCSHIQKALHCGYNEALKYSIEICGN